jgi:hypothetical protein
MKIKLLDNNFVGDLGSSKTFPPKSFEWDKSPGGGDLIFFTDNCLALADLGVYKNSKKIAWVLEPFPINDRPYRYLAENFHKFDLILSHNIDFVSRLGDRGAYFYNGMSLINPIDWRAHEKTKFMSIVVSTKNMTQDHGFRHQLVHEIRKRKLPVDLYGKGYNFVEDKADALRDYMFSIALENCQIDSYISDKIHDCFATYTLPVYRGCASIKDFFNMDGIFPIQTIEDTIKMIENLQRDGEQIYYSKAKVAMDDNCRRAEKLRSAEDYIYDNILKPRGLI